MSFVRYSPEDQVTTSETIVRGAWDNDSNTLSLFTTSSIISSSYFLNVYNRDFTSSLAFTIQYGDIKGSGSSPINSSVPGLTPTRVTYGQFRSLIYNDESSSFNFGGITSDDFFTLSISRDKFKESIKPGSLTLRLSGSTIISLTDNSVVLGNTSNFIGSNRYFTLISGSAGTAATQISNPSGSYGLIFPDLGVIILNPRSLSVPSINGGIGLSINSGSVSGNPNLNTLYNSISGSGLFRLQSQETISSRIFFTRVKNSEFNYSTNPSIINDSGSLIYDTLIDNPQTYITTIGMYNDNNELLSVAKLSKPLIKDYSKEGLIRIKIDY